MLRGISQSRSRTRLVEPHLLHARLTLLRLALLFLLGALIWLGKRVLVPSDLPTRPLVVTVPARAGAYEIDRAIDLAVLAAFAIDQGALETDPVSQRQLALDLSAAYPGKAGAEEARRLGLERADPVLMQRLAFQGEQLLRARIPIVAPGQEELQAYLDAHKGRYEIPAEVDLTQVFVSANMAPAAFAAREKAIASAFAQHPDMKALSGLGDPSLLPTDLRGVTSAALDATFGPNFGQQVMTAPVRTLTGPISSSYGLHWVYVDARRAGRLPELRAIEARVRSDFVEDRRNSQLHLRRRALRARYEISLQRAR